MHWLTIIAAIAVILASPPLAAQNETRAESEAIPPPPDIPTAEERARAEAAAAERADEPERPPRDDVIERVEGNQTITEYRRFGQIYMVKIQTKNAPAQYWVDPDGDGQFQKREMDINEDINLPKWRIGNW